MNRKIDIRGPALKESHCGARIPGGGEAKRTVEVKGGGENPQRQKEGTYLNEPSIQS